MCGGKAALRNSSGSWLFHDGPPDSAFYKPVVSESLLAIHSPLIENPKSRKPDNSL